MVRRSQLAHAALAVVGLALVVAGLAGLGYLGVGQGEYTHDVEPVSGSAVPADETALGFDGLSADGKAVLRNALGTDGETTVRTDDRVPEFSYGDVSGTYYVVADGTYYRVRTGGGGVLSDLDEVASVALLALGVVAVLAGSVDLYRHRSRE